MRLGVGGCLALVGNGDEIEEDNPRLAGGAGGTLRAAGPRGGDMDAEGASRGPERGVSLTDPVPEAIVRRGDCSREGSGERALMELGRGDAFSEAGRDVMADDIPDSRTGDARLNGRCLSPIRFRLGDLELGRYDPPRGAMSGDLIRGLLSRLSRPYGGERDLRLWSMPLASRYTFEKQALYQGIPTYRHVCRNHDLCPSCGLDPSRAPYRVPSPYEVSEAAQISCLEWVTLVLTSCVAEAQVTASWAAIVYALVFVADLLFHEIALFARIYHRHFLTVVGVDIDLERSYRNLG